MISNIQTDYRAHKPPKRIVIYSHDTQGLGHLRRNINIAGILSNERDSIDFLLICGNSEAAQLSLPKRTDIIVLPSVGKDIHGTYRPRYLGIELEEVITIRKSVIYEAIRGFKPDLLIVDKTPWGFKRELEPSLAMIKDTMDCRCVLGLRDILDEPKSAKQEWRSLDNDGAVEDFYEQIWIYGDPRVHRLDELCRFKESVKKKSIYTGYINPLDVPTRDGTRYSSKDITLNRGMHRPYVLCLVGGGQDGYQLASFFSHSEFGDKRHGVIVTGPFMPSQHVNTLRAIEAERENLVVYEFSSDIMPLISRAERVVSMGGYNTVSEVIAFRKPALIVPRTLPREEQLVRAQALSELGAIDYVLPELLNSEYITNWIAAPSKSQVSHQISIDFNGAAKIRFLASSLMTRG